MHSGLANLRFNSSIFVAGVTALGLGCFGSHETVVKAVDVNASEGATIEVRSSDSQELAGTRLVIPPESLTADTRITVALQREDIVMSPDEPAGPVAVWGPEGTVFRDEATLTLPFELSGDQNLAALFLEALEADGKRLQFFQPELAVDAEAGVATATILGFTQYQLGIRGCPSVDPPPGQVDHSCPPETICCRGKCESLPSEVCETTGTGGTEMHDAGTRPPVVATSSHTPPVAELLCSACLDYIRPPDAGTAAGEDASPSRLACGNRGCEGDPCVYMRNTNVNPCYDRWRLLDCVTAEENPCLYVFPEDGGERECNLGVITLTDCRAYCLQNFGTSDGYCHAVGSANWACEC